MIRVPEMLREGAATYEERNKLYGDNYKRHGMVMAALFPNGVQLNNMDDHNRFGILTQKVAKLTRYAQNFTTGGHADSLHDDMVYTAMLAELDEEIAAHAAQYEGDNSHVDWSDLQGEQTDTVDSGAVTVISEDILSELSDAELSAAALEALAEKPPVVIPEENKG